MPDHLQFYVLTAVHQRIIMDENNRLLVHASFILSIDTHPGFICDGMSIHRPMFIHRDNVHPSTSRKPQFNSHRVDGSGAFEVSSTAPGRLDVESLFHFYAFGKSLLHGASIEPLLGHIWLQTVHRKQKKEKPLWNAIASMAELQMSAVGEVGTVLASNVVVVLSFNAKLTRYRSRGNALGRLFVFEVQRRSIIRD